VKAKYPGKPGPEFYRDTAGDYRWRVWSVNGRILADSGEGYRRKAGAMRGFRATSLILRAAWRHP
jgi:hypothetical protein